MSTDEKKPRERRSSRSREARKQLEKRLLQLQALHRIGVAMASTMNPTRIMELVLSEMARFAGAFSAKIYLTDEQTQQLVPRLRYGTHDSGDPVDLVLSDDLIAEVAHTGTATLAHSKSAPWRAAIPLVAGEEILGVVDLLLAERPQPGDDVLELLSTLAGQAAQVLRNASTHEELEQRYREMSLLYEIQQEMASAFNYRKVLTLIVERTQRLLNASEVSIRLLNVRNGRTYIRVAATTGDRVFGPEETPFEENCLDYSTLGGEVLYIEDLRADPRFPPQSEGAVPAVSMLCVPLVSHRKMIGTIRIYASDRRAFSVSDRKMLLAVAGQAATAIDNARLYNQVETKNRELVASYEKLRRTQKELVRKERLAALGTMAATVAHEIRNPLTSVRGFAQRIRKLYGSAADNRFNEYLRIIMEEVDRLDKFIADVLDFARHVKPSFERTNLNLILSEIVTMMRDELSEKGIVLLPDFDMNLRETVLDASLIRQMFLNIIQNAQQACGAKGIIILKTQNSGNYVRVRVTDNGQGIARDALQKIWSPFFTTKTQGTGLGLALVQRIIDDHHGRIFIRSRVNYGTIVDIFLPVVESEEAFLALE